MALRQEWLRQARFSPQTGSSQFSERKKRAQVLYQRFVLHGIDGTSPWIDLKGQIFLGDRGFIEGVKSCRVPDDNLKEVPRFQRDADRPSRAMLFHDTASHDLSARNRAIHAAHVVHHYTLKEIGDHVRLHYTTVSRITRSQGNSSKVAIGCCVTSSSMKQ
jgi:putative transposase